MNIDEIIELLIEVRVNLTVLKKSVTSKEIKEQLKRLFNGIDIVLSELRSVFIIIFLNLLLYNFNCFWWI